MKHPEHLKATRGDFKARSRLGQATRGPFSWPVAFSLSRCFSALGPKCPLPSVAPLVGRCRPFFSRTLRLYCAYSLLLQACRSRLFLLFSAHVAYSQTRLRATAAALESRVHRTQCKLLLSQDQACAACTASSLGFEVTLRSYLPLYSTRENNDAVLVHEWSRTRLKRANIALHIYKHRGLHNLLHVKRDERKQTLHVRLKRASTAPHCCRTARAALLAASAARQTDDFASTLRACGYCAAWLPRSAGCAAGCTRSATNDLAGTPECASTAPHGCHAARAALLAARTAQLTNRRRASRRGDCLRLRAAAPMRAAERRAACCRRRREAPKTKGKRRASRRSDGWLRAEGLHNWRRRDAVKNEREGPCASRLRARASCATTGRAESARRRNVHRPGAPRHARSDDEWSTTVHRTAPRGVTSVAD